MKTCKFVHYELLAEYNDEKGGNDTQTVASEVSSPEWIQCDVRTFDMAVLGKFAVVMLDPTLGYSHDGMKIATGIAMIQKITMIMN